MSRHSPLGASAWVCALLLCAACAVRAADQSFDPRLEAGGLHDSNLRLVSPPLEDGVTGGYIDALATWSALTPLTEFTLTPRVRATRYSGSGESGTSNGYLSGKLVHRLVRGRLGLAFDLSKQEVLSAELLNANGGNDLGSPGTGSAGLAFRNNKALFTRVQPTARFTLGARTQLLIDTQLARVDYDQNVALVQNNYTDVSGSFGLSVQATQRLRWVANLTADRFTPTAGNQDASNLGANVELWHEQSQLLRAFVRMGAVRTQFPGSNLPGDTNANAGLGVQRDFATGQLFLQATRRVDASSLGQAVLRDELNLNLTKSLSEHVLLALSAVGVRTGPVGSNSAIGKQHYNVTSVGGEWRVRRTVSLVARYQYAAGHFNNNAQSPDSNAVYSGVVFEPHRRN